MLRFFSLENVRTDYERALKLVSSCLALFGGGCVTLVTTAIIGTVGKGLRLLI